MANDHSFELPKELRQLLREKMQSHHYKIVTRLKQITPGCTAYKESLNSFYRNLWQGDGTLAWKKLYCHILVCLLKRLANWSYSLLLIGDFSVLPDDSKVIEDDEKAECLAGSLEQQCVLSTQSTNTAHLCKVEEAHSLHGRRDDDHNEKLQKPVSTLSWCYV